MNDYEWKKSIDQEGVYEQHVNGYFTYPHTKVVALTKKGQMILHRAFHDMDHTYFEQLIELSPASNENWEIINDNILSERTHLHQEEEHYIGEIYYEH